MENYDGSITIRTALDNTGFEKDSTELISAIKSLTTAINQMGQTLQATFSNYANSIQVTVSKTGQMRKATAGASGELGKLGKSVTGLESLADKAASGNEQAAAKLQAGFEQASQKVAELHQQIEEMGQAKLPTEDYQWLCDEIKKVDKQLEKYEDRQAKLKAVGASEETQAWRSLQFDIEQARANLEDLKATKADMEAEGTAFTSGVDTEAYQQAVQQLDQISQKLAEIQAKSETALQAPGTEGLQDAITLTDRLKSGFARIASTAGSALGTVVQKALSAAGALLRITGSGIIAGLKKVASCSLLAAKNLAKMAGRSILAGIKKVTSSITHLGSSAGRSGNGFTGGLKAMMKYGLGVRSLFALINKLRRALTEGMQNLAQVDPQFNGVMSSFIGSLKNLGNAFATAFAPIAEYVLPVLTQLINVISEVISRVGMLFASLTGKSTFTKATGYQYDYAKATGNAADSTAKETEEAEELQKTLAGFDDVEILKEDKKSDSKLDQGSSTSTIGDFTEVPIETAMSDLAQMIKDCWDKQDFTSLGRLIGEKIRDALNSIPWDSIKEQLRKIATSIATFLNGFLETPGLFDAIGRTLAEILNSAFEFLNAFAQAFHWDSLGIAIRDGILGLLNNIDWQLIYDTMGLYGTGLGTALSNAFDNPEVWTAGFTAIANGINSIVNFIDSFLQAVDWGSLAGNIATGLNAGIEAIDWNGIVSLLCNLINGVFDAWYEFFTTVNWYRFGELVGTSLSKVLNEVNWKKGGASVAATINALFDALNGFIDNTDWAQLGRAVIDALAGFFGKLDWKGFGKLLSNVWIALFDFLYGIIDEVDWEKLPDDICQTVGDFLAGFDWTKFCQSLGRMLGAAFKGLIKAGSVLWNDMKEFGNDIIEGGWQGIKDALKSVGSWIQENILDPFISAFKDAFGIHSPAKVMMPLGENIIAGVLQGIEDAWHTITDFFNQCGEKISAVFSKLGEWWKSIGHNLTVGICNGITGAWHYITDFFGQCGSSINNIFVQIEQWWFNIGHNLVIGIWNGIVDGWNWMCNSVWDLAGNLWNGICSYFGINSPSRLAKDTMKWLPIGMAQGVEQTADQAIDSVMELAQSMQDEASVNPIMEVDTAFIDGTEGLENVLTTFSDKIVTSFDNLLSNLDRIAQQAGFSMPALATGTVTPYSAGASSSGSVVQDVVDAISSQDTVTRDDLRDLINELGRKIEGVSFVIGDEQIARHANKGNERLSRRYKTSD